MPLRKYIQVSVVKNQLVGHFILGVTLQWKIEFVASPETSQNHVFRVKTS
jgi:hypothetical protein